MEQKKCKRCGAYNDAENKFCKYCGARLQEDQQKTEVPPIDPSVYGGMPMGGYSSDPSYPPMRWYQFLIYFALFAGAFLNVIDALRIFFGIFYIDAELGNITETLYASVAGMRILDYCYAAVLILFSAFMIYTRFSLAGYRKFAPQLIIALYPIAGLVNALYNMLVLLLGQSGLSADYIIMNVITIFFGMGGNILIAVLNYIYFSKRKHLFNK